MAGEQAQEIRHGLVRQVFVELADELAQPRGVAAPAEQVEFGSLDVELAEVHTIHLHRLEQIVECHRLNRVLDETRAFLDQRATEAETIRAKKSHAPTLARQGFLDDDGPRHLGVVQTLALEIGLVGFDGDDAGLRGVEPEEERRGPDVGPDIDDGPALAPVDLYE